MVRRAICGCALGATALALVLSACRPPLEPASITPSRAPAPAPASAPALTPAARIDALEQRLLDAERVHVVFEIDSEGEVATDLRGILVVGPGDRALLEATGTFAGKAGTARIECDGTTLRGSSGAARLEVPCPAGLRAALVLGLVRMGVLHNIARAWASKPPDRADVGGADIGPDSPTDPTATMDAWVTTTGHRTAPEANNAIAFEILVEGDAVAQATLRLGDDALPLDREQVVHFPGGEMRVVERYEAVDVPPPSR